MATPSEHSGPVIATAETPTRFPIPGRLNLFIATVQSAALLALLWLSSQVSGWKLALAALGYGLVMNSAYALLHDAEHNILHPNRRVNEAVGIWLTLFFPAPFHLIRQGHIGHHLRNRSDDEAFDFYFEGENPLWKYLQLYGILTGLFWLAIALGNFVVLLVPGLLKPRYATFDRPTAALLASLNPRFQALVRWEAGAVVLLHGTLMWVWQAPPLHYLAVLAGFGVIWSALQYVHHFGTERDVQKGARNLRLFAVLDLLWLNHNWHLNHHLRPTVPWLYLPLVGDGGETPAPRGNLVLAYLKMWRGPRLTHEHVENRYAGRIIR